MAVISKTNILNFTDLVGQSYGDIIDSYGSYDIPNSAVASVGQAKVFVRGGAETASGVRQTETGANGTTLDLLPTKSTDVVTVRRGEFYINHNRQILQSNRTFDFGTLLPAKWWYGAGFDNDDDAALQGISKHAQRSKALIYASDEVITVTTHPGATDMVSGENYQTTHADWRLDGTTNALAAPLVAPTADVYLDKIQLYISYNGAPNTGLIAYVYIDAGSAPGTPVYTSLKVNPSVSAGEWIDFIFDTEALLTGAGDYWIVLYSDTPDDGTASTLSASVYYSWHYDNGTGGNTALGIKYTDNNGGLWVNVAGAGAVDKMPALRYIEYLKVKYTGVAAVAQAENVVNLPTASTVPGDLAIIDPGVAHAKIALCDLFSAAVDPASNAATANFGTVYTTSSIMTDVRDIIGYEGLEDDDQMSILFPAINTTENEIINIATEASTSPVSADFAALCSGLLSHVTSLATGFTFKSYWKAAEAYFTRNFRKLWKFNQNEELCARFAKFTFDGSGPLAYALSLDARYVPDSTYAASLSAGTTLEVHMPVGEGNIGSTTDFYVYGITTVYTTLNGRCAAGAAYLTVDDPSIFDTVLAIPKVYLWVEKFGGTNGELLKISAVTGNILTLVAEAGFIGAVTLSSHEVGERVWLVDRISQQLTTATGLDAANITLTPSISGAKYVGVAYVEPQSNATNPGTATDVIEIRSV